MREKRSVWVIEQGSYSDYRVVGVFSSQQNAELVAARLADNYDQPEVQEWALDPCVDDINAGRTTFFVVMAMDGTVERCEAATLSGYEVGETVRLWERTKAPAYRGKQGVQDAVSGTVWATDTEHAVKIVNERRIQYLATQTARP